MPRNQGTSRKGKPKKGERAAGMGRALQKAQRSPAVKRNHGNGGMSLDQGLVAPPMSLGALSAGVEEKNKSIMELNPLDDFLLQAELAGREFSSEKERFVVLDSHGFEYEPSRRQVRWEDQSPAQVPQFTFQELSVPRRPKWDSNTTRDQLEQMENESFLAWRRQIAAKEEELFARQDGQEHAYNSKTVTPYEKNLQVWRQLWRVLERSSCVVQLVDARNPLFYLSDDLRQYAAELGKPMMVIVNKSDYLSVKQRRLWTKHFEENCWHHVFFSAHVEQAKLDLAARTGNVNDTALNDCGSLKGETDYEIDDQDMTQHVGQSNDSVSNNIGIENPLTRQELIDWMHEFANANNCKPDTRYDNRIQFGMVGFPNVGKSSVINVLVGSSKHTHGVVRVGVASQPGKTKHFQTLHLPDREDMMLCDCPGLVFPSFVSNTADLIAAGVYPIAQMRDHWPVVELICKRIPREIINASYGIQLPKPSTQEMKEGAMENLPQPTADEFLTTYCVARSMLAASSGVPDVTRASRIVVSDYVSGKLLYCHLPPDAVDKPDFHRETVATAIRNTRKLREKLLDATNRLDLESSHDIVEDDNPEDGIVNDSVDGELLDLLAGSATESNELPRRGKKQKKWGKKGRKNRDKDPYGCHSTPDEILDFASAPRKGVAMTKGKYGNNNYSRPTTFEVPRS